jgi:hypothetical protein
VTDLTTADLTFDERLAWKWLGPEIEVEVGRPAHTGTGTDGGWSVWSGLAGVTSVLW